MKMPDFLQRALIGKRLLIFDIDGVIVNTSTLHAKAFAELLHPYGVAVDIATIDGRSTADALELCFFKAGLKLPSDAEIAGMIHKKHECVRRIIQSDLQPLPGVDRFLRWAKGRYWLAIVTSESRRTVNLVLEQFGYTSWFNPQITTDEVAITKPNLGVYHTALASTGFATTDALIFVNPDVGFAAARAASIDYVDAGLLGF